MSQSAKKGMLKKPLSGVFYKGLSKKELIFLGLRILALSFLLAGVLWSRCRLSKQKEPKKTLLERKARFIPPLPKEAPKP